MYLIYLLEPVFSHSQNSNVLHLDRMKDFLVLITTNAKNCFPQSFEEFRRKSNERQIYFRKVLTTQ